MGQFLLEDFGELELESLRDRPVLLCELLWHRFGLLACLGEKV